MTTTIKDLRKAVEESQGLRFQTPLWLIPQHYGRNNTTTDTKKKEALSEVRNQESRDISK